MEAASFLKEGKYPLAFCHSRHLTKIRGVDEDEEDGRKEACPWRLMERMKTVSVALVVCLNIGVDPPDVSKTTRCARLESWVDPNLYNPLKALNQIGAALQRHYERWQPRARYKQSLDPTFEEVQRLALALRKNAKDERVLFHYNGHGVPKPTANGEIWVFNRDYTQYIPLCLYDLQTWVGSPSLFVYDCSYAGIITSAFEQFALQHEREYMEMVNRREPNSGPLPPPVISSRNCIQLGACSANEQLPMNPELPADLFTSCLVTPVKTALEWFVLQKKGQIDSNVTLEMLNKIPGQVNDRRTMLGELNWILTAITDTIAWNTLSRDLFQKLFRTDLLVASLFRNFLLAERIMRSYGCTPVSQPKLPPTHHHFMWQAWDLAVDMCLSQLPEIIENQKPYESSAFFEEQLTAFEVWLLYGPYTKKPPQQLPIVLQVLLSHDHRLRALDLLSRFLDLGPWAVNLALYVGIFPYVLRLLQSSARELRPLLVSIWTKILAVDPSCRADLLRDKCHKYFLCVLQDPIMMPEHRTGAAFVLASVLAPFNSNCKFGTIQEEKGSLISIFLEQLVEDPEPILRQWLAIALGRVWDNSESSKWRGARDNAHGRLYELLAHPVPEVRTAAVYALGTFIRATDESNKSAHAESLDNKIALYLLNVVSEDASPMVRMELIVALQWLVYAFEANFILVIKSGKDQQHELVRLQQSNNNIISLGNRLSRMQASVSSPSLDRLVTSSGPKSSVTTSTSNVMSKYSGIYSKIYAGLVQLSFDPFDEVAHMASQLLQYLKCKESERDVFQSKKYTPKKSISPKDNPKSESVAWSLEVNFPKDPANTTTGPSLSTRETIHRKKISNQLKQSASPELMHIMDVLPSSCTTSDSTAAKPEMSTEFIEWSSTYFSSKFMKKSYDEEPDLESKNYWEKDWLNKRNESIRFKASEQSHKFSYGTHNGSKGKIEEQLSVIRFTEAASAIRFHPYNSYLAVGTKLNVNVFDVKNGRRVVSLPVNQNSRETRITDIEFINARQNYMLLAGSEDGSVRVWRDIESRPVLVTAWFAMPDLCSSYRRSESKSSVSGDFGMQVCWEEVNRCLVVGGGMSRTIRAWDAEKEQKIHEWTVSPDSFVSHISCTDITPWVYGVGFTDGTIRVLDKRISNPSVQIYREHNTGILDLKLRGSVDGTSNASCMIAGDASGAVRFYEPRALSSSRVIHLGSSSASLGYGVSTMSIHERAHAVGAWTSSQVCTIHSLLSNGPQVNAIKYYDGILGQRLVNVKCLRFHPHLLTLAVYAKSTSNNDSMITSFGLKSSS